MNIRKPTVIGLLALMLFSLIGACGKNVTTPSTTIVDDLGRSVTITSSPQRIVSWGPSNTEILFALGLGDKIVGVDDYSNFPAEADDKAKVGGFTPSLEIIVGLDPDMVLAIQGESVAQMESLGLTVVVLDPRDLDGVFADIALVGSITGTEEKAAEIVKDMKKQVKSVKDKVKGAIPVTAFIEIDATNPVKPWTAGPGTFIDSFVTLAGGLNIAGNVPSQWFEYSLEQLVGTDPEVILLTDYSTVESVRQRSGWEDLSAVTTGKVYSLNADLASRPGPRLAQGLAEIANALHPELFH